jgi:PIN domain nuclease of toxin-antitoxin system
VGVTYLLDTHVLLWLLSDPDRVSPGVRELLADRTCALYASAASAHEVATKWRLGKLPAGQSLVDGWTARLQRLDCHELPITSRHAIFAGVLEWEHRDPFDRLLVAQAVSADMTLVTTDRHIMAFPGLRTLSW